MKKSLYYLGISSVLLFSAAAQAQTIVSTTPENKNVVLEEFTGIYCVYCPDGHVIAQALKDDNPGDVVLINVHTGSFAEPSGSDPDFRTAFGSALANQSGLCGYPAGTVNRHEFAGLAQTGSGCTATTAMGRGDWGTAATQALGESSPVNVAATAELDVLTGIMTIYVEAYYTANSAAATNMLTVAISENGVKGPQTGAASFNPGNIDADGLYSHNHVLRTFVTGQWGKTISTTTMGTLFSDTYTYTVPADYNGIAPNIGNFEVAVYIAEGQEEILTGVMVPVTFTNVATSNNAAVASVKDLGDVCGTTISPVVTVQNLGGTNLTSLDITYDINGGTSNSHSWTGDLGYYATENVTLPAVSFTAQGTNTINVSFSNPNGSTDEDTSDDTDNATFSDAPAATTVVDLTLLLDDYCGETTWEVQNSSGTVMASGGPYDCDVNGGGAQAGATITETFNLGTNGCYSFVISDSYGDGLNAAAFGGTDGSYSLMSNSVVIASGGGAEQFSEESKPFEVTGGSTTGITSIDAVSGVSVYPNPFNNHATVEFTLLSKEQVLVEVTNVVGELVYTENRGTLSSGTHKVNIAGDDLAPGVYFVRIQIGADAITKKIIHN